jgi:FtsP/CotA-like multicopper oxidase with cupredoxin domain
MRCGIFSPASAVAYMLASSSNHWTANASNVFDDSTTSQRVVEYNLTIGYFLAAPDGVPVNVLGINGEVPSPRLDVTQGDTLVVNVVNQDPAHGHSLHWHGLSMKGSPSMDGVVGVTQCSLRPFQSMQYRFKIVDEPGTCKYYIYIYMCVYKCAFFCIVCTMFSIDIQ